PRQSFALQNFDTPLGKGVTPPSQANNLIGGVIEIIAASDRYTAVYAAAARIQQMRQNGWDFRDIAILCGDRSHYEKILQTVFDRLNIPMFVDTETDILSHPLTEMIRAALDICIKNWDYESVFRFLKTRLTGISPDAVDILENFVLANGISSYRWQYPFKEALVQPAQAQLLKAMEPFKKHADSVDTFRNHSKRVFDMLYSLNVPETLQRWILIQNDDPAVVRLHTQIWPKLCEVFDKLVEILGDEKVSLKTFAATLDAGLCQVGLGRIPPTVDQIVLGDISRSRYPQIKAMIVLGANDGVLPQIPVQSGLFTDHERGLLKNSRLELAPDNFRKMSESNYNLYCALSQPSDKLIFIYAQTNGKPLRPAPIIHKIKRLFPNLAVTPAPLITEYYETNGQPTEIFNPVALAPATVSQIYEQKIYTAATRLEAFARCPFAYYMNYILGAKPRKHYEILPTDLGKLFHDVVAGFTNRVKDFNVKDFNVKNFDLSRYEINKIVDELVTGLNLENSVFHDTARNKHILTKLRRVAAASCWALSEQIRRGVYVPAMTEQEISGIIPLENGKSLHISGRIDRVDIAKNEDGSELLQIIDYKTGSGKFSTDEVLKGVQLQLMLYMNLLTKSRKNALPGGVFYFRADDPIIQTDIHLDEHARNEALLKAFKMSGIEAGDSREFTLLSAQTENKIKELGTRLTLGDISAAPYTKGAKCPCNFCAFTGVCNNAKG
ncbi:MAG: PD-(D/E)XK nuclease family protein, partial [Defluviitaleaceae bacterium]|nr:PD-(D/E)XK nuclease family protein [Defluviitaleaceae bacterium]